VSCHADPHSRNHARIPTRDCANDDDQTDDCAHIAVVTLSACQGHNLERLLVLLGSEATHWALRVPEYS